MFTALGFREPVGHIDFYANGGTDQPGCPKTIFSGKVYKMMEKINYINNTTLDCSNLSLSCPSAGGAYFKCDHQRSVLLFLDSLSRKCTSNAFPCTSNQDFLDGNCLSCERFGDAGCPVFGWYFNTHCSSFHPSKSRHKPKKTYKNHFSCIRYMAFNRKMTTLLKAELTVVLWWCHVFLHNLHVSLF